MVKFNKGGIAGLIDRLRAVETAVRDTGEEIVRITAEERVVTMQVRIRTAVTRTGLRRVQTGGASSRYGSTEPGRVDSGAMVRALSSRVVVMGNHITGYWGWRTPQKYFREQEQGTDKIGPMLARYEGILDARERFRERVQRIGKGEVS